MEILRYENNAWRKTSYYDMQVGDRFMLLKDGKYYKDKKGDTCWLITKIHTMENDGRSGFSIKPCENV